ncbi:unnamed protein product [Schistocephalus solidus]|uniref:Uncharacterized protein n=1 Tax=Schistocephalus solidus TaxID=70667 RepID=A0A183TKF3_SCHSO|nr:unnamed protein product [Schistocephalus solidus]
MENSMGLYDLDGFNDNGLLERTCAVHRLILTNTFLCLLMRQKVTWVHPWSRDWHLLDKALVRQRASDKGDPWCQQLDG